jgi:DHA1 family inner membrane transport protein
MRGVVHFAALGIKPPSERFLLLLLAAVQFTHIMDFMILMPLGPQLMREWALGPSEFGHLVSVYTVVAGLAGLAMAPFADRFDRRHLLLACYAGFIGSTLACALSHSAASLLVARGFSGFFGGLAGTALMSIVGDVVPPARRGTAMGIIMTAFSVAAAVGVPFGLYLAQKFRWEAPFFLLVGLSVLNWGLLWRWLPPVRGHLDSGQVPGFGRFFALIRNRNALTGLGFMALLVFGHFSIIPLLAPHLVGTLGVPEDRLFLVYLIGGVLSAFSGPWVGRLSDRWGRVRVLTYLVAVATAVTLGIAQAPALPLGWVLLLAGSYFVFGSGRFVPGQAIVSLAVSRHDRGAYMSLNSCVRDFASGVSTTLGGWLVSQGADGRLQHFDRLGWVAVAGGLAALVVARRVRSVE